jgi:hypothetical protein
VDTLYEDHWIQCTADAVVIRGYYFPWGTKRVRYRDIREVRRVPMGTLTGQGRIWGSTTLRYWASLDPGRRNKSTALILDTGRRSMLPFITPDDPAAVAAVIGQHSSAKITSGPPVVA